MMQSLLELVYGRDFAINLLAGAVVFAFELVLLSVALPYFVQRKLDVRWRPSRRAFCGECRLLTERLLRIVPDLDAHFDGSRKASEKVGRKRGMSEDQITEIFLGNLRRELEKVGEQLDELPEALRRLIPIYSPAFTPEMTAAVVKLHDNLESVGISSGLLSLQLTPADWDQEFEDLNALDYALAVLQVCRSMEALQKSVGEPPLSARPEAFGDAKWGRTPEDVAMDQLSRWLAFRNRACGALKFPLTSSDRSAEIMREARELQAQETV